MNRLCLALFVVLLVSACSHDDKAYERALVQLTALEVSVDAHFEAARAENSLILSADPWGDRAALTHALATAKKEMAAARRDQAARITLAESILTLPALDHSARTRVLFHLDLSAQRAKLVVFTLTLEMYTALAAQAETADRATYAELSAVYASGIREANKRYRDLDLERQRQQRADAPGEGAGI